MYVTLEDLKNQCHSLDEDDQILQKYEAAAENRIAKYIERDLSDLTGADGAVPPEIYAAILILTDQLYRNREASSGFAQNAIPYGLIFLITPFRLQ